jgi:hypothetical protein
MFLNLTGKVNGCRIDLQHDPGLPPGSTVELQIDQHELPLEERRRRVRQTSGAWGYDPSLEFIFDELAQARLTVPSRYVNLDAPP